MSRMEDIGHDGMGYTVLDEMAGVHRDGGIAPPGAGIMSDTVSPPVMKATNPKDAVGSLKLLWSVLPFRALTGAALALLSGSMKYGRHNYRPMGVRASVYFDANMRHMTAWWEGEDMDPDSRLCHVDLAIAGLLVLRDSMMEGNWNDDRPPRADPDWLRIANCRAKYMIKNFKGEPKKPFTQRDAP